MDTNKTHPPIDPGDYLAPPPADQTTAGAALPWEQIENGRYMPRRIRGSCRGRELG
jgi:hypothetical protein